MGRQDIDVVVVGAGVIGLTAGVVLAEAGARVRILTAEKPSATTSAVAGALTGIMPPGSLPALERWGTITTDEFTMLAADPSTGVRLTSGLALARMEGEFPSSSTTLPGFAMLRPEELAEGFQSAFARRRRWSRCRATSATSPTATALPAASSPCVGCEPSPRPQSRPARW